VTKAVGWSEKGIGSKGGKGKTEEEPELDLEALGISDDEEKTEEEPAEEVEEEAPAPKAAAKKAPAKKEADDLDAEMQELLGGLDDESDQPKPDAPKKVAKKVVKKVAEKPAAAEESEEEDPALEQPFVGEDEEPEAEEQPAAKPVKKAAVKKKEPEVDESLEALKAKAAKVTSTRTVTAETKVAFDVKAECPVCRTLGCKDCDEDERTFVRRTRFEADAKKVACCPRCQAPLSVLYVPRPGAKAPFKLSNFAAVHGCALCHGDGLASTALAHHRAE
jgi:hypothetical protein